MNRIRQLLFAFFCLLACFLGAQEELPKPMQPPRLVNDFAGLLSDGQRDALERKLVAFDDSTSTQITIVIVQDLQGYDKADFAQRIGEAWKVGQKGFDNGVVILLKPKTKRGRGEAFIATGYGVEALIPDAIAKRIVMRKMIPFFKKGDYYGGLNAAVDEIMARLKGEFSKDSGEGSAFPVVIFLLFMIIFFVILVKGGRRGNGSSTGSGRGFTSVGGPFIWGSGFGGGSHGGFGGGSFGGGDFGGFGGGSFGGGGAGGSW